jgi:hypothetical protein
MTKVQAYYWGTNRIIFAHPNDVDAESAGFTTRVGTSNGVAYYCKAVGNTNHLAEKTVDMPAGCETNAGLATLCYCGTVIAKDEVPNTAYPHDYDYINNPEAKLVSFVYLSYGESGVKTVSCANCKNNKSEKTPALFECIGYSASALGNGGIALGYVINETALNDYTVATGTDISFGVFAASGEKLGADDAINKKGEVKQGVIAFDVTRYEFTAFEIKIVGFVTDEVKAAKIALGAYVLATKDEETTVSYIQSDKPAENEKYFLVSYNELAN